MFADKLFLHKSSVAFVYVASLIMAGAGLGNLQLSADTRQFYSDSNPYFKALQRFEDTFLPSNNILFVVRSEDPLENSSSVVEAIQWLTSEAQRLTNVRRVDSLATASYAYDDDGELRVDTYLDFVCPNGVCLNERVSALANHAVSNRIVSTDRRTVGVLANFELQRDEAEKIKQISDEAAELKARFEDRYPTSSAYLTGGIPMSQAFLDAGQRDSSTLFLVAGVVIVVALRLLLGDFRSTIVLLVIALSAVVYSMGLGGWLGVVLNTASATVPVVVLTLVVASSMHLFLYYLRLCDEPRTRSFAAKAALNAHLVPVVLTTLTSAVSMISLLFVDSPPIQDIGLLSAVGTMFGGILTITIAPLLLDSTKRKRNSPLNAALQRSLNRYAKSLEHAGAKSTFVMIILITFAFGATRIHIDDDFVGYFSERTTFKQDTRVALEHLSGPNHIEVEVTSESPGGVFEPDFLTLLKQMGDFLRSQEIVASAASLYDVMESVTAAMDPTLSIERADQRTLYQYFFAYELSLRQGDSTNDLVDNSYTSTHVSILLKDAPASRIRQLEDSIYDWFDTAPQRHGASILVTGENIPVAHLSSSNIPALLQAIATSLFFASVLLGIYFGSWRIGVSALAATIVPVLCGFGLWGWFNSSIGLASTVVIAVTIGVVIDDAIHLMYRQDRGVRELGQGPWESAAYSIHRVGAPIVSTTVLFVLGLSPLFFSDFEINSTFAACTSLILSMSLVFDLTVLPALMAWATKHSYRRAVVEAA